MSKPDFSEAMLQMVVNFELINTASKKVTPIIPSLIQEKKCGYDTKFKRYFGIGKSLFIQYKLSDLITKEGGNEWDSWKQEYYRFKLYHDKKGVKNLDQYNKLINLAKCNSYANTVLYATNSFIKCYELSNYFKKSELLSHIYCLNVSKIDFDKKLEHYHVTFIKKSEYFKLHSQIEKVDIDNFENIISNILFPQYYTFDEIKKFIENWINNQVLKEITDIDIKNFILNLIQREDSIANCFKAIDNTVKHLSELKLDKKFEPHLKKLLQYPQKIIELEERKSIQKTDKDKIVGKQKKQLYSLKIIIYLINIKNLKI